MTTSKKIIPWLTGFTLGILILSILGSSFFFFLFEERIYPGITVDQIKVAGLTKAQALQLLKHNLPTPKEHKVIIKVDDIQLASSSTQLQLHREYELAINQAYETGRKGFPLHRLWTLTKASFSPLDFKTFLSYDQSALEFFIQQLKQQVDLVGHNPQAILKYSGSPYSLVIDPGEPGREIKVFETSKIINSKIGIDLPLEAQVASTSTVLNQTQIDQAQKKAKKIIGKRIILKADGVRLDLNDQKAISLLAFPEGINNEKEEILLSEWQKLVARPAQNAKLEFDQKTLKVANFIPPREGLELNLAKTKDLLENTINNLTQEEIAGTQIGINNQVNIELDLPAQTTQPEVTLADTNNLGINERIGFGESEYDYSIKNRIHNVSITTEKITNTIVPPGKEFSFNKTLGDVSSVTGYRSAYIIKDGKTELGEGGGVCQVSTTVFRAALDAGLDITRRLPHSYRVSYYELNSKPGIDATVYAGNVDLRFINNTKEHLLIHANADSQELYMSVEIYGTSDGRTTEIKDHEIWGYSSPPAPEYYPDPSLPAGTKKQIDWAVGGVKAKFTHIIKDANGEITNEKTYYSNYKPWSAKYLIGQ